MLEPLVFDDLIEVPSADDDEALEEAARGIAPLIPDWDPIDELALLEGLLKKKFDPELHPRWPKGTPKAGRFMRKGDLFEADGKKWQVINAVKGHIEAVEASGKAANVEHRVFTPNQAAAPAADIGDPGKGVAIPNIKPTEIKFGGESSPIVIPYVQPETHDPSIKPHPESKLTPEQWKRFGKEDQLYYNEIMDRFGAWSASKGRSALNTLYKEYDSDVVQSVKHAYLQSTGPSAGTGVGVETFATSGTQKTAMNLAGLMKLKGFDTYQKTKVAFDELAEAVHWDLYNRVKAPDITLFHKGHRSPAEVTQTHLTGDAPIYAGFSQSWKMISWSGSTMMANPTAIRHLHLSWFTGGSVHTGEAEVASGVRQLLDDRTAVFSAATFGMTGTAAKQAVGKWLRSLTDQSPGSGEIVERLKKIWKGEGEIPIPEEPAGIMALNIAGKQYVPLPAETAKEAGKLAWDAKYQGGDKELSKGPLQDMGVVPGDFIEGLKGTRYVIIADAGDASGLRYVKIDPGTKLPNYDKSYHLSGSEANQFYRLHAHIDIPKPKAEKGFVPFTAAQYDALAPGEKKPMTQFAPGEMLKVDGEGYKIVGPSGDNKIQIESLDTGKQATINALYKGVPLVPQEDFAPPMSWAPEPGMLLVRNEGKTGSYLVRYLGEEDGTHFVAPMNGNQPMTFDTLDGLVPLDTQTPQSAEPGDIFTHQGKKYTVTSVLKTGVVRAKPTGGTVEKFVQPGNESDTLPAIIELHRPDTHKLGEKTKAKNLAVGDLISGSAAKQRPYRVIAVPELPNHIVVQNLETGEISTTSKNKSWVRLEGPPDPTIDTSVDSAPGNPETVLPPMVPSEEGTVPFSSLEPGDQFWNGGHTYEVIKTGPDAKVKVKKSDGTFGGELAWEIPDEPVDKLEPAVVSTSNFQPDKWAPQMDENGKEITIAPGDMNSGTVFLSATGLPLLLKSTMPKGGATAVALHNGKLIKNLPYDKQYTVLYPKAFDEKPIPHKDLKPGDQVLLGNLKVGDQYKTDTGYATVQVVESYGGDGQHMKIAHINDAGELGYPQVSQFSPDQSVILVKNADDAPATTPSEPIEMGQMGSAFDAGFEGYAHHKSGTAKHSHVGDLEPGTLFKDKSGKTWTLKAGGTGSAIISDGEKVYGVDAGEWVKPGDQFPNGLAMTDNTPPLHSESAKITAQMVHLGGENSLADLDLNTGDYFALNGSKGGVFKVVGFTEGGTLTMKVQDVDTNATQWIDPETAYPSGMAASTAAPGTQLSDLDLGDVFDFDPNGSALAPHGWVITSMGDGVTAENPATGNTWHGHSVPAYNVKKGGDIPSSDLKPGHAFTFGTMGQVFHVTHYDPAGNSAHHDGVFHYVNKEGVGGQIGTGVTVTKVDVPDWASPVASAPSAPPPPPSEPPAGPVKGTAKIGHEYNLGDQVKLVDLPPNTMALTPSGQLVYKSKFSQNVVHKIGVDADYKGAKTAMVTPVIPRIDTADYVNDSSEPFFDAAKAKVGDVFGFKGGDYLVVGVAPEGIHSQRLSGPATGTAGASIFWTPESDFPKLADSAVKRVPATATEDPLAAVKEKFPPGAQVEAMTGAGEGIKGVVTNHVMMHGGPALGIKELGSSTENYYDPHDVALTGPETPGTQIALGQTQVGDVFENEQFGHQYKIVDKTPTTVSYQAVNPPMPDSFAAEPVKVPQGATYDKAVKVISGPSVDDPAPPPSGNDSALADELKNEFTMSASEANGEPVLTPRDVKHYDYDLFDDLLGELAKGVAPAGMDEETINNDLWAELKSSPELFTDTWEGLVSSAKEIADKLGTTDADIESAGNFEDYMRAPTWPEGTPLPKDGDKVRYFDENGIQRIGKVDGLITTAPKVWGIRRQTVGHWDIEFVPEEDLVAPHNEVATPGQTTTYAHLANGDHVTLVTGQGATVVNNQISGLGVHVQLDGQPDTGTMIFGPDVVAGSGTKPLEYKWTANTSPFKSLPVGQVFKEGGDTAPITKVSASYAQGADGSQFTPNADYIPAYAADVDKPLPASVGPDNVSDWAHGALEDLPEGTPVTGGIHSIPSDPDTGGKPPGTMSLFDVDDGGRFKDELGDEYTKIGAGPVQGSVYVTDGKIKFQTPGEVVVQVTGGLDPSLDPEDAHELESLDPEPYGIVAGLNPKQQTAIAKLMFQGPVTNISYNANAALPHGLVTFMDGKEVRVYPSGATQEVPPAGDASNYAEAGASNLEPYLHHKSGTSTYDKIGTLVPGTEFTDKKKGKYRVLTHLGGSTVYEDIQSGEQFTTDHGDRVKVTKVPLAEMAVRFTTAGRVKLYEAA